MDLIEKDVQFNAHLDIDCIESLGPPQGYAPDCVLFGPLRIGEDPPIDRLELEHPFDLSSFGFG
jgi:hypothetical protein